MTSPLSDDRPLTVRLDGDQAVVSTDDGDSCLLPADAIRAAVDRVLGQQAPLGGESTTPASALSAGARAVLAEAAATVPVIRPPSPLSPRHPLRRHGTIPLAPAVGVGSFADVLAARRSSRGLKPPDSGLVLATLAGCIHTRSAGLGDDGWVLRRRAVPSAGGRHGIDPVLVATALTGLLDGAWHLDGDLLQASQLDVDRDTLEQYRTAAAAAAVLPGPPPALVLLVADFTATLLRYPTGASLVWRDAGALAATIHLACTAAGLESVVLGLGGLVPVQLRAALGWDTTRHLGLVGAVGISGG